MLHGNFIVYYDHDPLRSAFAIENIRGRPGRYLKTVPKFDAKICHKPGVRNAIADNLSSKNSQLGDEPKCMLHEKVESYLAHDEIAAVIDLTKSFTQLEQGPEQAGGYLSTMSSPRIKNKYRC